MGYQNPQIDREESRRDRRLPSEVYNALKAQIGVTGTICPQFCREYISVHSEYLGEDLTSELIVCKPSLFLIGRPLYSVLEITALS